jgi:uncharacterized protein YfaS (alpha-2-macroglobulin family)
MQPGQNTVRIRQSGGELLYFTISEHAYLPQQEISSEGNVQLERAYLDPQSGEPLSEVIAGQLVQVQISVEMPVDGFFIILEDKLPGGFEALNESLNTTSHASTALDEEPRYYWQEYGYNNKEVRADRVSFFIMAACGEYTYTIRRALILEALSPCQLSSRRCMTLRSGGVQPAQVWRSLNRRLAALILVVIEGVTLIA